MKPWHRRPAVSTPTGTPTITAEHSGTAAAVAGPTRRTRRPSLLVRIGGTLLTVVMALALIVFVSMTVLRISGGELLAIRTGSMSPVMEPGDLLISRDVDPRTIRRGDVITFRVPSADNTLVTHRVTKVDQEGNSFTTKGDANDTVDPFTTKSKDVLGIRWFSIPRVGRLMVFLSSGLGTALLIGIPAAIYLGQTLSDRRALQRARAAAATTAPTTAATTATSSQAASAPSVADPTPPEVVVPEVAAPPATTPPVSTPSATTPPATPPPCTLPPPATPPAPTALAPSSPAFPIAVPASQLPPSVAAQLAADWVLVVPIQPAIAFPPPVPATSTTEHQP